MTASTFAIDIEDAPLRELAARVGVHLLATRRRLITAESCTGGWIGKTVTDVAGSSVWYLGGAIAYSNELKQRVLGVSAATLAAHGAVSEASVCEMAEGALARMGGDIAIAVSGVAGPTGATADKPVGTVWIAWSRQFDAETTTISARFHFSGDREQIRRQTILQALNRVFEI